MELVKIMYIIIRRSNWTALPQSKLSIEKVKKWCKIESNERLANQILEDTQEETVKASSNHISIRSRAEQLKNMILPKKFAIEAQIKSENESDDKKIDKAIKKIRSR